MTKKSIRKGKTKIVEYSKVGTMIKGDAEAEARRWQRKIGDKGKVSVIKSGKFYYLKKVTVK